MTMPTLNPRGTVCRCGRLKTEFEIPKDGYENIQALRTILFEYIEAYYNPKRLHSSIGYKSPDKSEMMYHKNQVKQTTKV